MKSQLSINRLVNVDVNLAPNAAQIQNINTLMILGTSAVIDVVERYRAYGQLSDVAAEFGTSAEEYLEFQHHLKDRQEYPVLDSLLMHLC